MRGHFVICCIAYGLVANAFAQVESWTNQAGHVVNAELVEYASGSVTLKTAQGSTLRIPLSALCEHDQRRIRIQCNESIAPEFVQTAYRDARALIIRYDQHAGGWKDAEERRAACNLARAIFDARIAAQDAIRDDPAVQDEVRRLRSLLQ